MQAKTAAKHQRRIGRQGVLVAAVRFLAPALVCTLGAREAAARFMTRTTQPAESRVSAVYSLPTTLRAKAPLLPTAGLLVFGIGLAVLYATRLRRQSEQAHRESDEWWRFSIENAADGMWAWDVHTNRVFYSSGWKAMLGYRDEEISSSVNEWYDRVHPDDLPGVLETLRQHREGQTPWFVCEYRLRSKDGSYRWVLARAKIVSRSKCGTPLRMIGTHTDETERRLAESERVRLQQDLAHSQKLESLGRLAGGVAHDFNNLLCVVMGSAELAQQSLDDRVSVSDSLTEILRAAQRATALTRQLLAFARRETTKPQLVDLNELVAGMSTMLRRLIGENITLRWTPSRTPARVRIDPGQVDQVLANLAVNARDAIGNGPGTIVITADHVLIDGAAIVRYPNAIPGRYVRLRVSDTGLGMTQDVLVRVFEPFFTTKERGHGTGLGLATVYGIAHQNGGFATAASEPGRGSVFSVYLPRAQGSTAAAETPVPALVPLNGTETVLIVEDDAAVRELFVSILGRLGYRVRAEDSPWRALELARSDTAPIDLLITDVVMPGMNGLELSNALRTIRPDLKTLYVSGYPADIIARRGILFDGAQFLSKPCSAQSLARKVREVLSTPASADESPFERVSASA